MRGPAYCSDCGARLTLYVVGVCTRCDFDRTGDDPERDEREARESGSRSEGAGE